MAGVCVRSSGPDELARIDVKGPLDKEQVTIRAEANIDDVLLCYRRALAAAPELSSRTLTVRISVDHQGQTTKVTTDLSDDAESPELARCIAEDLEGRKFAKPPKDRPSLATIRYELLEAAPRG